MERDFKGVFSRRALARCATHCAILAIGLGLAGDLQAAGGRSGGGGGGGGRGGAPVMGGARGVGPRAGAQFRSGAGAPRFSPQARNFSRNGAVVNGQFGAGTARAFSASRENRHHRRFNRQFLTYPDSSYPYYPYYPPTYDYGTEAQYYDAPLYYSDAYIGGNAIGGSAATAYDASAVREVQAELARRGYYQGEVDGIMGQLTRQAITVFQRDNHITATGRITPAVLARLGLR